MSAACNTQHDAAQTTSARTELVAFDNSPFPYSGQPPGQDKPFYDVEKDGRRGHTSPRGGIYWEDTTYSDRRVLLHIPRGFNAALPAVMIVYLHGNLANLAGVVHRIQQVPRQVAESGLNAVLVAPQLAVNALDSSAGRFYDARRVSPLRRGGGKPPGAAARRSARPRGHREPAGDHRRLQRRVCAGGLGRAPWRPGRSAARHHPARRALRRDGQVRRLDRAARVAPSSSAPIRARPATRMRCCSGC